MSGSDRHTAAVHSPTAAYYADYLSPSPGAPNMTNSVSLAAAAVQAVRTEPSALTLNTTISSRPTASDLASYSCECWYILMRYNFGVVFGETVLSRLDADLV